MEKKQAIINTLMGKIQARSTKLFEDVNNEVWDFHKDENKDCDVEVDGEEIKTVGEDDEPEEKVSALDVILDAPVNTTEKEVKEF